MRGLHTSKLLCSGAVLFEGLESCFEKAQSKEKASKLFQLIFVPHKPYKLNHLSEGYCFKVLGSCFENPEALLSLLRFLLCELFPSPEHPSVNAVSALVHERCFRFLFFLG